MGGVPIRGWSTMQKTIALSSCEAEFVAASKAGSEMMGTRSIMADFGIHSNLALYIDASSAQAILAK